MRTVPFVVFANLLNDNNFLLSLKKKKPKITVNAVKFLEILSKTK